MLIANSIDKIAYYLVLQEAPGLGPKKIKCLLDKYTTIQGILNALEFEENNTLSEIDNYIKTVDLTPYKDIINKTYDVDGKIVLIEDDLYPRNLRLSETAPAVLFYKGDISKLSPRSLALVGTVNPTELGIKRADKFARLCAENSIQVISGLARGIDTISHKAALKYSGLTYAVIAHGIDMCYPPENKDLFEEITRNGAVISQFRTGLKPNRWMFPARNETMCTISSGTVIIEAVEKCGSLIQAKHSYRHGRRVFLLNSNTETNAKWAQDLLSKGAFLVRDFEVVKNAMGEINDSFKINKIEKEQLSIIDNFNTTKAMLFDVDGVLLNSLPALEETYRDVCIEMGIEKIDENVLKEKLTQAPPYVFKCLGIDGKAGNQLFKKKYLSVLQNKAEFFPGIFDTMLELKKMGYKLGIVTSQPLNRYKAIIEKAPFKNFIDIAITWNDIPSTQQKPNPAGILKALQKLNVEAKKAAYVGDTTKDIKASKNAGVLSIAVAWGYEPIKILQKMNPDIILNTPQDLLNIRL